MKVLALDTSNQTMTVAILNNNEILAEYTTNVQKNHSVRLMPAIEIIMEEAKVFPKELDKIVVGIGPGSYTGVRIGVTTVKTMAWSLNIPLVAVSSLELVAYNGLFYKGLICPFFDARRGQVYTGLYESDGTKISQIGEETNVLFSDWLEEAKKRNEQILFLSNDMAIHKELIEKILGNLAVFGPAYASVPKASVLGIIGEAKKEVESVHHLVPNYLRLVEAEAKWLKEQRKNHDE